MGHDDEPQTSGGIGRYQLQQRMARGGMGEVFRAVALGADGFNRPVVVKRILPSLAASEELVDMFTSEAKLMTRLLHPNIVQVLDFGRGPGGAYFLVLELVEGLDLGAYNKALRAAGERGFLSIALHVALQVLRGLEFAHAGTDIGHPLVHRDISPSNVLLSKLGEVKVADFGVAAVARPDDAHADTVVGKFGYMAPEQCRGDRVDPRADLFSLGVVLYETLAWRSPFEGDTGRDRQLAAMTGEHAPLSALRDDVPAQLDAILARALAPDPQARFGDAREMADAIRALRDAGVPIADADALGDAVRVAVEAAPPALVPVVALGDDVRAGAAEITRVTRVGTVGDFTIEVAPSLASGAHPSAAPRRSARWRRAGVAVAALMSVVAGGAAAVAVLRSSAQTSLNAPAIDVPDAPFVAPIRDDRVDVAASASSASASSAPSASASVLPARVAARASASASAPAAPSAVGSSANACAGDLHLFSHGSWVVAGGPSTVQAPGRYRWPCGSYSLSASSRMDASQIRSTAVVIREGGTAVFDLR